MSEHLALLKQKLAAREAVPGLEYKDNCKELRKEIARLEGREIDEQSDE